MFVRRLRVPYPTLVAGTRSPHYNHDMKLTREIRCWTGGFGAPETRATQGDQGRRSGQDYSVRNNWAGDGGDYAGDAFWTLRATVDGEVEPATGYLCDIRTIDEWLRASIVGPMRSRLSADRRKTQAAAGCLRDTVRAVVSSMPGLVELETIEWELSPFTRYAIVMKQPSVVALTRSYEFSASHRLACAGFSEEENRRVFGKCSNPYGHGHNYVVEVTVRGAPDDSTGQVLPVVELDRVVFERVIDPFDHRNLNAECPEFADLNPSVENIARVIFQRLAGAMGAAQLAEVRLWETAKTSATCMADDLLSG